MQQFSDDFLERWEHIIDEVNKTDIPLECIKKIVVKLNGKRQKTINLSTLKKQGLDWEEIEIIVTRILTEFGDEVEDWKFWESYWIEQFRCWGFKLENKNIGGNGPTGGYHLTEETKTKIGKSNSKPKPDGFGDMMSKQRKGNWTIPQHQIEAGILARNKPTMQYDLNGNFIKEYESSKIAAQSVGVHEVNMRLHLGGKYKTCKKFIFKYKDNG